MSSWFYIKRNSNKNNINSPYNNDNNLHAIGNNTKYCCSYQENNKKLTNDKMLQQEQCQINHGKSMHHLTFPTNYKQTMNNLIKAKNNTSTTLTPGRTTILDSSDSNQEQLQQAANTNVNYTNNTMDSTATPPPTQGVVNYGGSNTSPSTMGVNLRVTGQCSQGGRKYMEDYFSVAYQQSENAKDLEYAFIGIYDGHGGAEAATFAKEHLMMQIINQKAFWSESDDDVLRAIREGYIATHYAMWRDQENWPKTANGLLSTAGTTATIAFIRREKIYIGHVGDSGIVLGYQNEGEKYWRARQLTIDHKPESMEERARIQRSGGKVVVKSGVPRVVWNRPRNAGHRGPIRCNTPVDEVPFLAVARSLGDLWSYNSKRNVFVVSPDPDVQVIKINPKTFRCLIFGTDGLWNVVTPKEAVNTVYERECINERLQAYVNADSGNNEWTNPSKGLVERALKTWSSKKMRADNTSVVTVILYPSANDSPNNSSVSPNMLSYNGLPKDSCGLEYTEVCAEVPAPENFGISFEEIAEKHTMPEAFRNFDYLLDEEAINASLQMQHEENCERKYCSEELSYWNNWSWEERQSGCAGDYNHQVASLATHSDLSICSKAIASHNIMCNTNGSITGDSDENAVDGVHANAVSDNAECESAVLNYPHYSADASNASSDVSNELGNAGFMTFAESYNSFLNEHMSHDSTNSSNSNSNCQIISGTSEILQEQQLYQQQCMSEEEGYSLTKLETRREQQRCTSGVQTFKIFQTLGTSGTSYVPQRAEQQENSLQQVDEQQSRENASLQLQTTATSRLTVEETRELEAALTWESSDCAPLATTINQFFTYPTEHPKPLELNSLLQQEREEEQQVAYERNLEMQRRIEHANVIKVAPVTAARTEGKAEPEAELHATLTTEEVEDALVVEYIEEDVESVEQLLTDTSITAQHKDARVQINEISSSMSEQTECDSSSSSSDNEVLASITAMPTTTSQTTQIIEKIEKIEILPQKLPTKLERVSSHTLLTQKTARHAQYKKSTARAASTTPANKSEKVKVTTYDFSSRPPKACPARTSLKRSQTQFPNIPNENARAASGTTSSHQLNKRRRYDAYNDYVLGAVSSTSNKTDIDADNTNSNNSNNCRSRRCNNNASLVHSGSSNCGAIALEKRQLRSNSGIVDYSKRTLRTRNSLSKDLKAKASLTSTMRRVTTQFLHETAVSLMTSSSALAQQRQQQRSANAAANSSLLSRSSSGTNSNSCSSSSGSAGRRSRAEKLLTTSTDNLEAAFSHVINLRSRKVAHFAAAAAAAAAAVNHTQTTRRPKGIVGSATLLTTTASTALRRERHNLRSLSTRNAASPPGLMSANGQRDYAYAHKSNTRSGLHATGLCAYNLPSSTAPTPKLLNGAAGVNAATRARAHALLMAKQSVGAAGGAVPASGLCASGVRGGGGAASSLTPTSYGKRTTALRSGAVGSSSASTIMLTRSGGRNGRRLNR